MKLVKTNQKGRNIMQNKLQGQRKEIRYEEKDYDEIKKHGNALYPWIPDGFCILLR